MKLSFVIISHRPVSLRLCLASLDLAGCDETEIVVLLNGLGRSSELLRAELAARWPHLRVFAISRRSRGAARNAMLEHARGEILYFLDDDVIAPPGFCRRVLDKFSRHPEVYYGGGPNLGTLDSTAFQSAVNASLSSPWGAGPMRVRYCAEGRDRLLAAWGFMLCNLGVRRQVFSEDGLAFPESCVSAEENLLLHRAQTRHGPGLFSPELYVYHARRRDLGGFCRQAFLSGAGRMQVTFLAPGSLQWVTLLPLAGLAGGAMLCLRPWRTAGAAALAIYAGTCAVMALRELLRSRRPSAAAWLPLVAALGHCSYALGMLAGIGLALFPRRDGRAASSMIEMGQASEGLKLRGGQWAWPFARR